MALPEILRKAESGEAYAQGQLAWMYENALGVGRDYEKARRGRADAREPRPVSCAA